MTSGFVRPGGNPGGPFHGQSPFHGPMGPGPGAGPDVFMG